jgi:hypothetical protein
MTPEIEAERRAQLPAGAMRVADKQSDAVAYVYQLATGEPAAAAFAGRRTKPDWRYRFRGSENGLAAREKTIRDYFESARSLQALKAERQARKAAPHNLQLGAIFYASWGYDQTNVDFYQVTAVLGPRMVEIREIAGAPVFPDDSGGFSGRIVADPGNFTGEARRVRVTAGSIKVGHTHASVWDGHPCYWSSYH